MTLAEVARTMDAMRWVGMALVAGACFASACLDFGETSGSKPDSGSGGTGTGAIDGGGFPGTDGSNLGSSGGSAGTDGGSPDSGSCSPVCSSVFESCQGGACDCAPPLVRCGTSCVDTAVDAMNCGACGTVCKGGRVCSGGACVCPSNTDLCNDVCQTRGMQTNCNIGGQQCWNCCGSCISGNDICIDNACTTLEACPAGTTQCGSVNQRACVDLTTDRWNCGACDQKCADTEICAAGSCQPYRPAFSCSACPCVEQCTELVGPVHRCCPSESAGGLPICVGGVDCP